jgi:hypothetical protein
MEVTDEIIRRVISRSRIPTATRQREVERELRCHMEDTEEELRLLGHTDERIRELIAAQFGDSSEVASAFFEAYKPDRVALYSIYWFALALASLAAVTAVFLVVEALAAIGVGDVVNLTSADLRSGVIGLTALTWGYCGLFVGEKVFRRNSLLKSALLNVGLFALAVSVAHVVAPGRTLAPIVAFGCSASVCILQRAGMRFAWLVGSLGPLVFVRLVNGHVLSGSEHVNLRAVRLLVTLAITASCLILSFLPNLAERHLAGRLFAQRPFPSGPRA